MTFVAESRVRIKVQFRRAGMLVDPVVVTLAVRQPSGGLATHVYGVGSEIQRASVGVFYHDVLCRTPGTVRVRFGSTAQGEESIVEGQFLVRMPFS